MKDDWKDINGESGEILDGNPDIRRMSDGSIIHKGAAGDHMLMLITKYPNYREICSRPEFVGWYLRQPSEVIALGQNFNPIDAMKLLDIYHAEFGQPHVITH